jgi:meso-butanediol dehydrogenase / (S,S)-butanediol dehydrogenase / diacetyl reductase
MDRGSFSSDRSEKEPMGTGLLNRKVIFVTGGASGIGRECAIAYAREGARVVVADMHFDEAQETVNSLPIPGLAIHCDLRDESSVESAIRKTVSEFSGLDAIHNNVGISSPAKPLHETSEEEWDQLHLVNLKSVYWTTRFGLPSLAARRGSILNTASMVALLGQANHAAYVATKGALVSLTKAMALDYAPLGIRINAICPAGVWTPLLRKWVSEQPDPGATHEYLDRIHALGYCPEPDVIADVAVFLLSNKARFVTGCIMPVSGGAELGYSR